MHVHINTHLICKYFSHLKIHTFAQDTYANIQAHMYIHRWKTLHKHIHNYMHVQIHTTRACLTWFTRGVTGKGQCVQVQQSLAELG